MTTSPSHASGHGDPAGSTVKPLVSIVLPVYDEAAFLGENLGVIRATVARAVSTPVRQTADDWTPGCWWTSAGTSAAAPARGCREAARCCSGEASPS